MRYNRSFFFYCTQSSSVQKLLENRPGSKFLNEHSWKYWYTKTRIFFYMYMYHQWVKIYETLPLLEVPLLFNRSINLI